MTIKEAKDLLPGDVEARAAGVQHTVDTVTHLQDGYVQILSHERYKPYNKTSATIPGHAPVNVVSADIDNEGVKP